MSEILLIQVVFIICGTTAFAASLRFLRRVLELRHERALRAPPQDVSERLERIETAVETTAIEVERMAEANRFMAKLLAERHGLISVPVNPPERVITPH
jgi:hypothetical protein